MKKKALIITFGFILVFSLFIKTKALSMSDLGPTPFARAKQNPLGNDVKNIFLFELPSLNFSTEEDYKWDNARKSDVRALMKYCPDDVCMDSTFIDTFLIVPGGKYAEAEAFQEEVTTINTTLTKDNHKKGIHTAAGYAKYKESLKYTLINLKSVASANNKKINIILDVGIYDSTLMVPELTADTNPTESQINKVSNYVINMSSDLKTLFDEVDANQSTLKFVGFYWSNEQIGYGGYYGADNNENPKHDIAHKYYILEEEAMKKYNTWAHSQGYKTLWIPFMAGNAEEINGYDFGFDFVSLQTTHALKDPFDSISSDGINSYFNNPAKPSYDNHSYLSYHSYSELTSNIAANRYYRLNLATEIANQKGFGIEFEKAYYHYQDAKAYNRLMEFLTWSVNFENWYQPVNVYYDEVLIVGNSTKRHGNQLFHRDLYDLTYKYATGKLTSTDVTNLAKGKNYTLSPAAYENSSSDKGYANDVNGNELTDDVFGSENYGTEWIAFHKNSLNDGKASVVVDLGQTYNGVYKFLAEFRDLAPSGIGKPSKVEIFYSTDNVHWKSYGIMPTGNYKENTRYIGRIAGNPVSARYIKYEMTASDKTFIFMSEVQVYRKNTVTLEENGSVESVIGSDPVKVLLTNESNNTLSIASSDINIAKGEIILENGNIYLRIDPVSPGTATIMITELGTYSYTTLDVVVTEGNGTSTPGNDDSGSSDESSTGVIAVPNTLSLVSPFAIIMAIILIILGIGFFIYANKRLN